MDEFKVPTPERAPADHPHEYCERGCDENQAHCWLCPDRMDNAHLDWAEAQHEAALTLRRERDALLGHVRLAVAHWDGRDVTDEEVEAARTLIAEIDAAAAATPGTGAQERSPSA